MAEEVLFIPLPIQPSYQAPATCQRKARLVNRPKWFYTQVLPNYKGKIMPTHTNVSNNTKDTQLHLDIFSCDDFSVKLRTISTVQIFIISAYFLFSVGDPVVHFCILSEWHFSEGDNFQICWPLNSSYRPLVWSTEIVVIIKEDHFRFSGTKYLSVDQQKEIVFMMYFLMPVVGLISRSSLPLWEPLATYGY